MGAFRVSSRGASHLRQAGDSMAAARSLRKIAASDPEMMRWSQVMVTVICLTTPMPSTWRCARAHAHAPKGAERERENTKLGKENPPRWRSLLWQVALKRVARHALLFTKREKKKKKDGAAFARPRPWGR